MDLGLQPAFVLFPTSQGSLLMLAGQRSNSETITSLRFLSSCVHAKSLQSCPTLCNPVDCSPSGCSVHGIFQARILEWVTISFSTGSSQPRDQIHISSISYITGRLFTTEPPGKPTDALMHLAGAFVVEMKACPWPCSDAMAAMKGGDRLRGRGGRRRCRYMLWLLGTLSQLAAWSSTAGNN